MKTLKRLVVLDPNTLAYSGHNYEYTCSVLEAARDLGANPLWVSHLLLPQQLIPTGVAHAAAFTGDSYGFNTVDADSLASDSATVNEPGVTRSGLQNIKKMVRAFIPQSVRQKRAKQALTAQRSATEERYFQDLVRFFTSQVGKQLADKAEQNLLFIHTTSLPHLKGWARFVTSQSTLRIAQKFRWAVVLRDRIHANASECVIDGDVEFLLQHQEILGMVPKSLRVQYFSDTSILAKEYGLIAKAPCHVLPVPFRGTSLSGEKQNKAPHEIHLAYLGAPRREKGFEQVLRAVDIFLNSTNASGDHKLVFHLQIGKGQTEDAPTHGIDSVLDRVRNHAQCRVYTQGLSPNEYYSVMQASDAVLIPYDIDLYYGRTSGVFTESYAAGKACIVTQPTWMSDCLKEFGSGLELPDDSITALVDAFHTLASNGAEKFKPSKESLAKFNAFHNPANLVRILNETFEVFSK